MQRNVSDIHQEISEEAASIANMEANHSGILPLGVYGLFKPKRRGKLGLTISEYIDDPELLPQLRDIGKRALKQALVERPDLVVGMILGDARQGQNYFERWNK